MSLLAPRLSQLLYSSQAHLRIPLRYASSSSVAFKKILDDQLNGIKEAGTWKTERIITTKQSPSVGIEGKQDHILNFCANNYLGFSSHPDIIQASKDTLDKYGNGLSSVRFICGTQDIHKQLEGKISQFHETEDAVLYACCFDANTGLFEAILSPEDALFSDETNHASIIDGIRLCKAKKFKYKHVDMKDLEAKLQEAEGARIKLIVTDGVFSMDGTIAPLDEICDLADKYGALTMVDECHATGFMGKTGRGTDEYMGVKGKIDIINSTLGKALGGAAGGYTTGPKQLIQILRQKSRPYLYSNTLPPSVVGSAIKVSGGVDGHPIVPIMLGEERLAVEFATEMFDHGIYVIGMTFPTVQRGTARIRVQISAAHTAEQIERCVDAFVSVGKAKGVIN
ncbi:hypothetical protein QZH41_014720 [Actinostola sp. cb2023]|nr:hypothetical protein QZH41_014720 [Actinostola sp. cb2023]